MTDALIFPYLTVVQTEPRQIEMHPYSDSSEAEAEAESGVPASPRASQSTDSRAKVRFRYSKGTGSHAAQHDGTWKFKPKDNQCA